jgi:predicted dinucleotide-binding enzyme
VKVGVIGSGDVAQILAAGFLKHGHSVTIGTRSPEKLAWGTPATVGSFADAAAFAEVAVLAVKVRVRMRAAHHCRFGLGLAVC